VRNILIGIFAAIVLTSATAHAADAPVPYGAPPPHYGPPPPYAPPAPQYGPPILIYPWVGPYVGVNAGFQWTSNTGGPSPSGFAGGLQGGFNWQSGPWVYGVETDFNLSGASDRFADFQFSNPWFGTIRGRAGYAVDAVFLYGTGGLAYGINTVERAGLSDSSAHLGWTIGAGVEFGLAPLGFGPRWSAKAEYLHLGLSQGAVLPASIPANFQSNVFHLGVNYHF